MNRLTLERYQVWIYLAAIVTGLVLGSSWPGIGSHLEALLWPILAVLLYTTFVQAPLLHIRNAFRDQRFALAIMTGNCLLPNSVSHPATGVRSFPNAG